VAPSFLQAYCAAGARSWASYSRSGECPDGVFSMEVLDVIAISRRVIF
jgi:hypothetical protein